LNLIFHSFMALNQKTMLTNKQKEDFFIKVYFNTKEGFEIAGLKRAYQDFNRTLKKENEDQKLRNNKRYNTQEYLKNELLKLISTKIENQQMFDKLHENLCVNLTKKWNELTIGQAQKWINMTLKYWLLFGEKRINNIEKNAKFFHIPIDNFVLKEMLEEKSPGPWSKIDKYKDYFRYQEKQRNKKTGNPPIIDEFDFFNSLG